MIFGIDPITFAATAGLISLIYQMICFWTIVSRIEKLQDYCYKMHMDILTIKESKTLHDTIILIPGKES